MLHNQGMGSDSDGRPNATPWWKRVPYGWRVALAVFAYLIIALIVVINAPAALLNNWVPGLPAEEQGKLLGAAGNLVLLALGGVIAVVTVGISLSRHRHERDRLQDDRDRERARREEVDAQRRVETERTLRERFVTTVQLLSDPAPVNRQAALFALGALADDWAAFGNPDEVQVCIEVLTGYLRAPRSESMLAPRVGSSSRQSESIARLSTGRTAPQEIAVRQAGYAVIRDHLRKESAFNWQARQFNLEGAHIDFRVDLSRAILRRGGRIMLSRATIADRAYVDLEDASIRDHASLVFMGATFTGDAHLQLARVQVSGAGVLLFVGAKLRNTAGVSIAHASLQDNASVPLPGMSLEDRANLDLSGLTTHDPEMFSPLRVSIRDDAYVLMPDGKRGEGSW